MKSWQIVTILLMCLIVVTSTACNPFTDDEQETTQKLIEVARGDLTIIVSGSGNIKIIDEMKLAFGVAGRVDKIYIEEGDEVSEGETLASLETDALELAVTQAKVAHTKAQVTITEVEITVTQAEVAVTQAEINLKSAEISLEQTQETYTLSDIKAARADADTAMRDWEDALMTLYHYDPGTPGWEEYQKIVNQTQLRLNTAEDKLDAMLSGADTKEVAIKKMQVEAAQQSLELTQQSLKLTQPSLQLAQQSLQLAQQSLVHAQKQLNEATITAPFDGVIARVGADEDDTVSVTTIIVHLIDLDSMELKAQVDEIDITQVKLGQKAIIEVDALPALLLEGKVSSINLLPIVEAGVIVYDVEVEFDVAEGTGLRTGMSASTNIIITERSNVLLVPERAIKEASQGNPVVEVIVNEQTEQRAVVIGISDGFQTEILSGLEEGEIVER